ncbi:hypothetical protein [Naasia aerilata]|uniref:Aldose 1-epimerase n=1 Tax=Naasia aerilata TaxID=1162966 RepID=A0ABM8G9N4_9MICO|nr:hypothetical protein [Naasia aerilata]BDZ44915.1 hypothetical protein GCM10025866_08240 [Naasia aerilata]
MLPTGEQFRLTLDGARGFVTATVTELAASLRALTVGGIALVHEYPDHLTPPYGAGIVLVPWPNRVRQGRWMLNGAEQRLDITEPSSGNATHGLLRNTGYRVTDRGRVRSPSRRRCSHSTGIPSSWRHPCATS